KVDVRQARDGYVGMLDVMPLHGKAGESFTVKGEKLPPNQEFQLVWETVDGNWKVTETEYQGREFTPVAYEMAKVKSDAQGRINASFTTPDDFGFDHTILLQQRDRLLTQVNYSIDMTVDYAPKSGPVGTPITFTVKGVGWRSLYNSWDLLYDNHFTGWLSSVSTHGDATFTYSNPEQNPAQGRPRFDFVFKVTPGAPVLPPAPELQAQKTVRLPAPQG